MAEGTHVFINCISEVPLKNCKTSIVIMTKNLVNGFILKYKGTYPFITDDGTDLCFLIFTAKL
jgi:hypothetical protein